ncbi:MAG: hypothetical protein Q4P78_02820 [Rothia sp. (in: high G+C Gram-positive bacteria)]|uniref:SAF domain-containing protein n=1 Tax=Rothia sp. (in: high G+C Gram-positive bacteria) TaxID=1885016 RepID=UPI0026DF6BE8|nr:SAF domain-containing protein [Rothia sp. (in: high G+C Gram-positive bacteria)]MDO5750122.1 hypothetical protein [Rothia sp. (in: high G+C Gram-positive bacteria)]
MTQPTTVYRAPEIKPSTAGRNASRLRDPRMLLGLLLCAASFIGVQSYAQGSNSTQNYYVATREIHIGEKLDESAFQTRPMNLGDSAGSYYAADQKPTGYANRHMAAGNLISKDSVSAEYSQNRRAVSVAMDKNTIAHLHAGDSVDIWVIGENASKTGADGQTQGAAPIAHNAEIVSINSEENVLGSTGKASVQVLVSQEELTNVVAATNGKDIVRMVPAQPAGAAPSAKGN